MANSTTTSDGVSIALARTLYEENCEMYGAKPIPWEELGEGQLEYIWQANIALQALVGTNDIPLPDRLLSKALNGIMHRIVEARKNPDEYEDKTYAQGLTDAFLIFQTVYGKPEGTEGGQFANEANPLPELTAGEWMALFLMANHDKHLSLSYPQSLPLLVRKGLAEKDTETLTAKGRELIEQVNRLTEQDWRNVPKVKIRRAAATLWPERFLDDEDPETRNTAEYFGRHRP